MDIGYDVSLAGMNTFGMKVNTRCLVEYDSVAELMSLDPGSLPAPMFHIGGGSNLLFTGDFPGTILHSRIRDMEPYRMQEYMLLKVGSGVLWDDLCAWAADHDLWGTENLSLIPGEVGAAAVQNIGAYGVEASDVVDSVDCFDLSSRSMVTFAAADCGYGYRTSNFKTIWKGRYIVTSVNIRFSKEYHPVTGYGNVLSALVDRYGEYVVNQGGLTPSMLRETVKSIRESKLPDPSVTGSAGSFFRNPVVPREEYEAIAGSSIVPVPHYDMGDKVKIPAGWLIEQCGWKGCVRGNVGVCPTQALVIVNVTGKALPREVLELEADIRSSVLERFGISLSAEVEHVGENDLQ